jgi:ribonuclease HI
MTLPSTNPIHQIIQKAKRDRPSKFPGPIDRLLKQFGLLNTKLETIYPAVTLTHSNNRFQTKIDNSREDSINFETTDSADFKIFSDGSGHGNGIGSAAILYVKDRARPVRSLRAFLGTSDKHNTYEAEVVGVILALWIIQSVPETLGKKVTLYIDNQSVIKAITTPSSTSGQHLLNSLRTAANRTGCRLTIRWISSHSKVKGNEEVDKLAKDAADGKSSTRNELPHILRNPLPTSASALKQTFNAELKSSWARNWDASPRKTRLVQFGEVFPYTAFIGRVNMLTRKQSSLILQIRCGHFPLNAYLHKINKVESNRCQACDVDQEELSPPGTINHFIFECEAHAEARHVLVEEIGLDQFHFPNIVADTNRMKSLTTFINRSGRFKD